MADRAPLQPVGRTWLIQDPRRVDREVGDAGRALELL